MSSELFIGLMSGTSMDGVDGVLIDLAPAAGMRVMAHAHQPYDEALRQELLALNQPGQNELHRCALAANAVSRAYAAVVRKLLAKTGTEPTRVRALGAHGQTVRHRPLEFDGVGYTTQLLNGSLLAELTMIPVVTDFRSRDLAAGGQGAPLVPAFHHAAFGQFGRDVAVLNIGGIANVTLLPASGNVSGHDCGPGNVLLDLWCARHTGRLYDRDGEWGRSGHCHNDLLTALLQDPFVQRCPPKSTGRDHFHAGMLDEVLQRYSALNPVDVQSTLTHFTAQAAAKSVRESLPDCETLLVCGGGALNGFLMQCLQESLPRVNVCRINDATALDPFHVEAAAFAWLAQAHVAATFGNLPAVTGASAPRILGALYPA
jgi:anhydro-N-acetylmuramic acid kinase